MPCSRAVSAFAAVPRTPATMPAATSSLIDFAMVPDLPLWTGVGAIQRGTRIGQAEKTPSERQEPRYGGFQTLSSRRSCTANDRRAGPDRHSQYGWKQKSVVQPPSGQINNGSHPLLTFGCGRAASTTSTTRASILNPGRRPSQDARSEMPTPLEADVHQGRPKFREVSLISMRLARPTGIEPVFRP